MTPARRRARPRDPPGTRTRPPRGGRSESALPGPGCPCRKPSSLASLPGAHAPGHDRRGRKPDMTNLTEYVPCHEESIFLRVDRVGLHFNDKLMSKGEDPLQAARRFKGRQREEEVHHAVAPGQHAVY